MTQPVPSFIFAESARPKAEQTTQSAAAVTIAKNYQRLIWEDNETPYTPPSYLLWLK